MPGWYSGSYGLHADDGAIFSGDKIGEGKNWGPCWAKKGAIVGMGVQKNSEGNLQVFCTLNGRLLGVAFDNVINDHYYPVVGAFSAGASVKCYFQENDFLFDVANEMKMRKGNFAKEPQILIDSTEEEDIDSNESFLSKIFGSK